MVKVAIHNGQMRDQKADFVVCEINKKFAPLSGSGEVVWKEAGYKKIASLKPATALNDYDFVHTPAFNMETNFKRGILHFKIPSLSSKVLLDASNNLRLCYLAILQKAVDLKAQTIMLPFVGIVSSKFPYKEGTDIAMRTIAEFFSGNRTGELEEIVFLCTKSKVYNRAIKHELFLKQNFTLNIPMNADCYYQRNTPGEFEKKDRLIHFDLNSTLCSGMKQPVSSFIEQMNCDVDLRGCESILDLLNVRANGEAVDESNKTIMESRIICANHYYSLVENWEMSDIRHKNNRQPRSLVRGSEEVQCPLPHQTAADSEERRVVNKWMCMQYLRRENVLIPPGTRVCKRHQTKMNEGNAKFRRLSELESDPTEQIPVENDNHVDNSTPATDSSMVEEISDAQPVRIERNYAPEVIALVVQLIHALGGDRVITRGKWDETTDGTQRKKGYVVNRLMKAVCEVITPDGKEDLYLRAIGKHRKNEEKLADLLFDCIDERFATACNRREKIQLLSLVSDLGLTQNEIIRCVPSATLYYINRAKVFNKGGIDFDVKHQRERFDGNKSDRYVEFLTRSNVLVTIPWGDTITTLSDGTKTTIASVARKFTFSRIHRLYLRDLEATNEMHLKLGRGSTTGILKVLAKRMNERMTCVDEYAVDAYEGWRQLTAVVEELRELHGLIGNDEERAFKRWIRISRSHLEGEYITEIAESSNIPQHCTRYALSHSTMKCFSSNCDHLHVGHCKNCDQLDLLLATLESLTDRLFGEISASDSHKYHRIRRLHQVVQYSCRSIQSYQAHVLRTALSNSGRAEILDKLENGHSLITLDFSMKILPNKAIEGQSEFFAKKGIPLHITHVLAKIDGQLFDHCFAHTLDDVKQDSSLVYSVVRHTLRILEAKGVHTATFRSDNADKSIPDGHLVSLFLSAYKNSALIAALYQLSSPKMRIAGYHFSESQSGKGPCDRCAAHCKRKLREWLSEENDICNAFNIYEALTVKDETVRGLSTYHCTFTNTPSKSKNAFPGISQFFSFVFEPAGVRSRCQYGIGEGQLTKKEKLPNISCSLRIEDEGGHTGDSFWSSLESNDNEQTNIEEEEEEEDIDDSEMFHCSTPGCIKSFLTTRWLSAHERKNVHVFAEKKQTMTDRAVAQFKKLIETREAARIAVSEQVVASGEVNMGNEHEKGWALKSSNTTDSLDKIAKEYAEEYFNSQRSLVPPRRADAAVMRKRLVDAKNPADATASEYLLDYSMIPTEKQLQSLFSRLEASRVKGPKKSTSTAPKNPKPAKAASSTSKRIIPSVRSTIGETRKRRVVKESEEVEMIEELDDFEEDEVFEKEDGEEEEGEEEEGEEEIEILGSHEYDFIKKIIEEEKADIFD